MMQKCPQVVEIYFRFMIDDYIVSDVQPCNSRLAHRQTQLFAYSFDTLPYIT